MYSSKKMSFACFFYFQMLKICYTNFGDFMNQKYIPTWYLKNILDLNGNLLKEKGFKVVFCDIDNTLASPFEATASETIKELIQQLKNLNLKIILISNNKKERVALFAKSIDVDYIYKAKKPSCKKLNQLIDNIGIDKQHIVAIGDQIMTDVLCANKANISVILVDRLSPKDQLITFIPRRIDRIIRKRLIKKNLLRNFQ